MSERPVRGAVRWRGVALVLIMGWLVSACGAGDSSRAAVPGVELASAEGTYVEVTVPSGGDLGPVVEVLDAGSPVVLSVTASGELERRSVALVPADVDLSDYRLGWGLEGSAFMGSVRSEPAWLYLHAPKTGEYRLVVSPELRGETLSLELHEEDRPDRADIVGTWQLFDADRFAHFGPEGDFELGSEESPIGGSGTWTYADGELRSAMNGRDGETVDRVTLLPTGELAAARVTGSPTSHQDLSDAPFEPPSSIGRVTIFVPADT